MVLKIVRKYWYFGHWGLLNNQKAQRVQFHLQFSNQDSGKWREYRVNILYKKKNVSGIWFYRKHIFVDSHFLPILLLSMLPPNVDSLGFQICYILMYQGGEIAF